LYEHSSADFLLPAGAPFRRREPVQGFVRLSVAAELKRPADVALSTT